MYWVRAFVLHCLLLSLYGAEHNQRRWMADFAAEINLKDINEVELLVSQHGFKVVRKLEPLENVYHLQHLKNCNNERHRCKRNAEDIIEALKENPYVSHVEQQYALDTQLRNEHNMYYLDEEFNKKEYENRLKSYKTFMTSTFKKSMREKDDKWKKAEHSAEMQKKLASEDVDYFQNYVLKRTERSSHVTFNDPGWASQWQFNNVGQFSGTPGVDMNLLTAYEKDYRGQNTVASVIDDGVDTQHPELEGNYDPAASIDLNDLSDTYGNPRGPEKVMPEKDSHGTSCAGEIAAIANNKLCSVGVAHKTNIGGIRLLAGAVTDLLQAYAMVHNYQYIQVYSNSWGPPDDGKTMNKVSKYSKKAMEAGITKGRGGKGNIYVFASGNGGQNNMDNCGADEFSNLMFIFPATAVNVRGGTPYYTEKCAALLVAVPVGGHHDTSSNGRSDPRIVTTSINNGCKDSFVGTSAATPLLAACSLLALQANPDLTWRDLQHLMQRSARVPNRDQLVVQRNGAGIPVSHHYGFGLLDCGRLVMLAQNWTNVGPQHSCVVDSFKPDDLYINAHKKTLIEFSTDGCLHDPDNRVDRIEHVLVHLNVSHVYRGALGIWVTSPAGTRSPLLLPRKSDTTDKGIDFTFLSRMHMQERPVGDWIVEIVDNGGDGDGDESNFKSRGKVNSASLTLTGTAHPEDTMRTTPTHRESAHGVEGKAHVMSAEEVAKEYHERRKEFISQQPLHRKVFEVKKELQLLKNSKKAVYTKKFKQGLADLASDDSITTSELRSIVKDLKGLKKHFSSDSKSLPTSDKFQNAHSEDKDEDEDMEVNNEKNDKRSDTMDDVDDNDIDFIVKKFFEENKY